MSYRINNAIVLAMKTFMSEGVYKIPMLKMEKNRKFNPKTNRMKNFRKVMHHETDIAPEKRTFRNLPKYASGAPQVGFRQWLLINQEKDGAYGKSEADGKWYGWSHRAVFGFGEGDRVEGGSMGKKNSSEKDFTVKNDAHAKEVAKQFARNVS